MKLGDYTLRRATQADAAGIWSHIAGILQSYGITPDTETTDRDLKDIAQHFGRNRGVFYVLLDRETLIGTVAYRVSPPDSAEICRMYLAKAYRGKGLGRLMLDHVSEQAAARGIRRLYLKTASVLEEAIALYRKAGFRLIEHGHIDGNCDVLMEKMLKQAPHPRRVAGTGTRRRGG